MVCVCVCVCVCPTGGALAEGFEERLKEFQCFERRFEASVCVIV